MASETSRGQRFGGADRSWTAADRRALVLLVVLVAVGLPFLTHSWYDRTNDGSVYLSTARSLLRGEGYAYLGEPFRIRPPGLALLLMPFVRGTQIDFGGANLLVGAFGAAAAVLLFVYARARLGATLAFGTAVLVWLTPGYQRLANQVMSDVPGLALFLACLLVERWASRRGSLAREVALGLTIGVSAWVRSAAILLVPAIWASRLLRPNPDGVRGGWRRFAPFAVAALAAIAPWFARNAACAPEGAVDQTAQYSLSTLLLREDPGDPGSPRASLGELLAGLPVRTGELLRATGTLALDGSRGIPRPLLGGFGVLVLLLAGAALVRRREPAELYLAATLLLLLALPSTFLARYALPLMVLVAPTAVEALRGLFGTVAPGRRAWMLTVAAVVLGIALTARPRQGWDEIELEHARLEQLTQKLAKRLEPDMRIAAPVGWHLTLILDRPVYSLRFAYVRFRAAAPAVDLVVQKYGVDTIVLVAGDWPGDEVSRALAESGLQPRVFRVAGLPVQVFRVR